MKENEYLILLDGRIYSLKEINTKVSLKKLNQTFQQYGIKILGKKEITKQ